MIFRTTPVVLLVGLAVAGFAQQAIVTKVIDGDTFVATLNTKSEQIRLNCVDAPELAQPHGGEAASALRTMIEGKVITLNPVGRDRDGALQVDAFINARYLNLHLVSEGHAWMYRDSCNNEAFPVSELKARTARVGLWRNESALKPWEFRASQGRMSIGSSESRALKATIANAELPQQSIPAISSPPPAPLNSAAPVAPVATSSPETTHSPGNATTDAAKTSNAHIETKGNGSEIYRSSGAADGRTVNTGPRGGKYTISPTGRKVYIPKSRR